MQDPDSTLNPASEPCVGCAGVFVPRDGPTHAYLTTSAACWACFNESLALHYGDATYWPAHQILTDAYALQHSARDDPRARRSAVLHLVALYAQCELNLPREHVVDIRRAMAAKKIEIGFENWPAPTTSINQVDITHGPDAHLESAYDYGRTVCNDWHAHHGVAQRFCDSLLGP